MVKDTSWLPRKLRTPFTETQSGEAGGISGGDPVRAPDHQLEQPHHLLDVCRGRGSTPFLVSRCHPRCAGCKASKVGFVGPAGRRQQLGGVGVLPSGAGVPLLGIASSRPARSSCGASPRLAQRCGDAQRLGSNPGGHRPRPSVHGRSSGTVFPWGSQPDPSITDLRRSSVPGCGAHGELPHTPESHRTSPRGPEVFPWSDTAPSPRLCQHSQITR